MKTLTDRVIQLAAELKVSSTSIIVEIGELTKYGYTVEELVDYKEADYVRRKK